jgi:hypothetical protein
MDHRGVPRTRMTRMKSDIGAARVYVAPTITVLGSVHALTQQQDKKLGLADGFTFMGSSITNNS